MKRKHITILIILATVSFVSCSSSTSIESKGSGLYTVDLDIATKNLGEVFCIQRYIKELKQ